MATDRPFSLMESQGQDLNAIHIGGPLSTRTALAQLLNSYFDPAYPVAPEHVVLSAGGSAALDALIEQICDPGDAILLETPYWSGLDICLSKNEVKVVKVRTDGDAKLEREKTLDPYNRCNIEQEQTKSLMIAYETALRLSREAGMKIRALLCCNPTNPIGQCYTKAGLQALVAFCARENLHFISDEVYALSVYRPGSRFVSALSISGEDSLENRSKFEGRIHVIYSLSKDFGCSGIRLGALITQSAPQVYLACALALTNQVSVFTSHLATTALLPSVTLAPFLATNTLRLRATCAIVELFLRKHAIPYTPPEAGIYISAKLCRRRDCTEARERELLLKMKDKNVCVVPGKAYHFTEPGWFRIVFSFPKQIVDDGLQRILDAMRDAGEAAGEIALGERDGKDNKIDIFSSNDGVCNTKLEYELGASRLGAPSLALKRKRSKEYLAREEQRID
ncbi:MAG: hypothetical protein Q9157_002102 [Trypethelium eluteriae]